MVKSYLEKCRQELQELQIDLSNQLQKLDFVMKDKMELIQYIEDSEDKSFDSFSPQTFRTDMDQQKIRIIREELEQNKQEIDRLKTRQSHVLSSITEIENVIQLQRENEKIDSDLKKKLKDDRLFQQRILEVQELEFQRIAKKLNNSSIRKLSGFAKRTELCGQLIDMDKERCRVELQNMSHTICDVINEMEHIVYSLYPISNQEFDLNEILKNYIHQLLQNTNIKYHFQTGEDDGVISSFVTLSIFHIAQEIFDNILSHANADNIWITIDCEEQIVIMIRDDGCGFDLELLNQNYESSSRTGFYIIYQKVRLLSGTISIQSELGIGTKIQIKIPRV